MSDIARLSIAIDSTTAKTATVGLERLGAAGRSMGEKLTKMCTGLNIALGYVGIQAKSLVSEVTVLAARFETLGMVMNVAGKNAGYGADQMAQYEKELRKTGISALESRQSLASMATANIDLAQSSKIARAAQDLAVVGNINSGSTAWPF